MSNKYQEVEKFQSLVIWFAGIVTHTEYLSSLQKEAKASEHDKQGHLKWAKHSEYLEQKQKDIMQLDGTRWVAVDGYASACCVLDLWTFDPKI